MFSININQIKTMFSFFFKIGLRAKRTKWFFILSLMPAAIFLLIKIVSASTGSTGPMHPFLRIGGVFYFQLFIQILCLFYGTSVLNDEVEDKTLIYLTTSSASRASVYAGKFLANFGILSIITTLGMSVSYAVAAAAGLRDAGLEYFGLFLGAGLLALWAYAAFFALLGILMKRSILMGLFFVFGWEKITQGIPGTVQKLGIGHFVNSLLPQQLFERKSVLTMLRTSSPTVESIVVLVLLGVAFTALSIFVFHKKEFTLSQQG
ncbi:MAG: ABC transporter permease subunit [bacterium]|nr:ABC transporter permease subunit [bacterium]